MQHVRVGLVVFCSILWMPLSGQDRSSTEAQGGVDAAASGGHPLPVDLAGYGSVQYLTAPGQTDAHAEYSGSIFLSKSLNRFRFHSEFNISNSSQYDGEGIHFAHLGSDWRIKMDSATLVYNLRDWLQLGAGFEFVPTYWRMHRYQSTTLTVENPIIDQRTFPTAFKGGMLKGDKYYEHGGVSYELYGGIAQQPEYLPTGQGIFLSRKPMMGGKFVVHIPTGGVVDICDVGFHRMRTMNSPGGIDELTGAEAHVVKGRMELLSELAHGSMGIQGGIRSYLRKGYYVQGSYRLTRNLYAVARTDRANLDSRFQGPNDLARWLWGLTFRPVSSLSLKIEVNHDQSPHRFGGPGFGLLPDPVSMPGPQSQPSGNGVSMAIVYFFHRP